MQKPYVEIHLPTESADGYYMNKSKMQVDNFIYLDKEWYSQLFDPTTFYILGPKGCGKTLYAAYMCAAQRNHTISKSYTIDVSDYGKLIAMKQSNHLNFTDYLTMWKVILLQKLLLGLDENELSFFGRSKNYETIQDTISKYFGYNVKDDSFNPTSVIDNSSKQDMVTKYLGNQLEFSFPSSESESTISASMKGTKAKKIVETANTKEETTFLNYTDTWLRAIDAFIKTAQNIAFKRNHYLFVDGLDVRPKNIDATEYGECIGALIRAVYQLNMNVFGNMKRRDNYEFKIIALTRTDIFLNSNLVNVTSCINDNCVELDWTYSNEKEFHHSKLFKMMNRLLGWDGYDEPALVDHYFRFNVPSSLSKNRALQADFYIQRLSRLRPRDIVVFLNLLQKECKKNGVNNPDAHSFDSYDLFYNYSNYYADQVKSEMMFTYSPEQIKNVFDLMKMIKSDSFVEREFKTTYNRYCINNPDFKKIFPDHRKLIDVLYSLDIIGWIEYSRYYAKVHWHYREVKAIDESYRLPWEQFDISKNPKLLIHAGASKHILGTAKK